jgi:hypothetical protein
VCGELEQALSPNDERELALLIDAVGAEITEISGEEFFGDLGDMLRMLFCIRRRAGAGGSTATNAEAIDDRIVVGELVYAPFNSPRLLAESTPNLHKEGIIPADTL